MLSYSLKNPKTILWVTHAPLDIPGYRATQYGIVSALTKCKWNIKFFTKKHKTSYLIPNEFRKNIFWIKSSKSIIITEFRLISGFYKKVLQFRPSVIVYESFATRYVIPVYIFIRMFKYSPKLILDIRTPPISEKRAIEIVGWVYWVICLYIARIITSGVTVISAPLLQFINKFIGKKKKTHVWSSGVDDKLFFPKFHSLIDIDNVNKDDIVMLHHGSISSSRGIVELVKALTITEKNYPKLKLIILGGDNDFKKVLKKVYIENGGNNNLILLNAVDNSEVPKYIAAADFGVCPLPLKWKWEVSSPLKVYEYLAMGKPVLASAIPAHYSAISDNKNGIIINNITAEETHKGLLIIISKIKELQNYSFKHRNQLIDDFRWDQIATNLDEYLCQRLK